MALKRDPAWWESLENTAPKMPHEGPLDHLELGDRAAARLTNENREGWGAWVPDSIFELRIGTWEPIPVEVARDLQGPGFAKRKKPFIPAQRQPKRAESRI